MSVRDKLITLSMPIYEFHHSRNAEHRTFYSLISREVCKNWEKLRTTALQQIAIILRKVPLLAKHEPVAMVTSSPLNGVNMDLAHLFNIHPWDDDINVLWFSLPLPRSPSLFFSDSQHRIPVLPLVNVLLSPAVKVQRKKMFWFMI